MMQPISYLSYRCQHHLKTDPCIRSEVLAPIQDEIAGIELKAIMLKRKLDQISEDVDANTEIFEKYKKRIRDIKNEALKEYGIFGSLEGVTAQILFESNWQ